VTGADPGGASHGTGAAGTGVGEVVAEDELAGAPDPAVDPAGWALAAERAVEAVASAEELRSLDPLLLGKRSQLTAARQRLGGLAPEERKAAGGELNRVRQQVEAAVERRRGELVAAERRARVEAERLDLTEPLAAARARSLGATSAACGAGVAVWRQGLVHLVQRTRDQLEDVFVGMGFTVADGPEVETDWYNFEALNMPPAHPARGMFDTFYLDVEPAESVVLRTHTSPVQIRVLQSGRLPVYAVMPGRCFRRETADARHFPVFHQVEGLVVDEGITFGDLAGTIETFTAAYFGPGISARLRPAFFPFTEPSAEFEITCTICHGAGCRTCSGTGWVELGGCGMVDPAVLQAVGVDPERYSGFAFGFGIDRCAQMRYGIPDMRAMFDNDVRVLRQA
jgi:phenylalanyl-tRNA synthetase alpha chain